MFMSVTQKLHGSNAQLLIYPDENGDMQLKAGSRSRWLEPGKNTDNYGFADFIYNNKQDIMDKLGEGRHYGEWCGPGINYGEGLTQKKLILFNWRRWKEKELPENFGTVPVLYTGKLSIDMVESVMEELKTNGSRLTPGFMKPEGVVVEIDGTFYKKVFELEDIPWKQTEKKERVIISDDEILHLLQPNRLKKLLSRDEQYLIDYPVSISRICADYVADLVDEKQFPDNEEEADALKKKLGRFVFKFVKTIINELN